MTSRVTVWSGSTGPKDRRAELWRVHDHLFISPLLVLIMHSRRVLQSTPAFESFPSIDRALSISSSRKRILDDTQPVWVKRPKAEVAAVAITSGGEDVETCRSFGEEEVVARLVAVDEFDISHGESCWVASGGDACSSV